MVERVRREYGSGSIHQRVSDGLWIGTLEAGWTAKGTRRRVTVSGKTEAIVKRKLRDKRTQIDTEGLPEANARDTVKVWAERWLAQVERKLSPSAYATSRSAMRKWIIPAIGHRRFQDLTPGDVRKVASDQHAAARSGSTQRRTQSVLMSMLKDATLEGYPVPPRIMGTELPRKSVSDRSALSVAEAVSILGVAATLPHGSRWVAALLQGMRQGESLGLTWDQVDLERNRIIVSWQLKHLPYRIPRDRTSGFRVPDEYESHHLAGAAHLVRPKTAAGWRVIPLVPWMHTALEAWREVAPPSPHGLVWPDLDGSPTYYKTDDLEWYGLQGTVAAGHPAGRYYTVHEARHTTATLLLEAGVDPAVIIAIMGHSDILTTRGYIHVNTGPVLDALSNVAKRLELQS